MNLDKFNKMFRLLDSSTGQISQHFFDDFVEENATRFHEMGLKSVLIRRQIGECCDYCKKLVGVYDYDDLPDGIYSRHRDCKCLLTFKTEKGGYVDVWSKKQFNTQRDARISRITEIEKQQAKKKLADLKKWPVNPLTGEKYKKHTVNYADKQLGKKIGKHAIDYGLDPANEKDRKQMLSIINNVINNADERVYGEWLGYKDNVIFHIKGNDVVIESAKGDFVSVLKDGVKNARVKVARKRQI